MNSLIYSANVIIPVFLLILVGMFSHRRGLISDDFITTSNKVVFTLALPASLFTMVYRTDFVALFTPSLYLVTFVGTMAGFIAAWLSNGLFCKSDDQRGAFIQASMRGNLAILGMAIIERALSPDAAALAAGLLAFLIPLYNVLAVIALTGWNKSGDRKERLKKQAKNIILNPLIIAIFLGIVFSLLKFRLPGLIETSLSYLSRMTLPLALLGIGGTLKISGLRARWIPTAAASFIKLILVPLLTLAVALPLGIRGETLAMIFILGGSSTAISSFAMAGALNNDTELSADIITMTTLISLLTIGGGLAVMKNMGILG
ncbi:MAG: AEC family transporter [Spirochaetales bacterium]|nr:AEC family transporter [Spirochaetales bacterium]